MSPKIFSLVLLLSAVFTAGCIGQESEESEGANQIPSEPAQHNVTITASGFGPQTLTINAGDTVTWINEDTAEHWPASAVHPTHTVYPEGGGCIGSAFDACEGLAQGESWSFTFSQEGSWRYHDHLNPSFTGTVVVQ